MIDYKKGGCSVWVSSDGRVTAIKELKTDHLCNIVALLLRDSGRAHEQRSKIISLKKELVKRLTT